MNEGLKAQSVAWMKTLLVTKGHIVLPDLPGSERAAQPDHRKSMKVKKKRQVSIKSVDIIVLFVGWGSLKMIWLDKEHGQDFKKINWVIIGNKKDHIATPYP